jgi:hypothetical protein
LKKILYACFSHSLRRERGEARAGVVQYGVTGIPIDNALSELNNSMTSACFTDGRKHSNKVTDSKIIRLMISFFLQKHDFF